MVPGVYSIAGTWSNGPAAYGASNIWTAILVMHGRNANNLMYQTLYHSSRGGGLVAILNRCHRRHVATLEHHAA
ncbi:hypothetical protein Q1M63_23270 [Sinorhizobium meliloti]|nr:hypothetical protein Q1M63_23270 [Sinorhizobium meliloti]